jgi:hypothetical protein
MKFTIASFLASCLAALVFLFISSTNCQRVPVNPLQVIASRLPVVASRLPVIASRPNNNNNNNFFRPFGIVSNSNAANGQRAINDTDKANDYDLHLPKRQTDFYYIYDTEE